MKPLPTFTLFDLKEEKQQEFIQVFKENCAQLRRKYLYYDQLRHHKYLWWYYKRISDRYYHRWQQYEKMVEQIIVNQKELNVTK